MSKCDFSKVAKHFCFFITGGKPRYSNSLFVGAPLWRKKKYIRFSVSLFLENLIANFGGYFVVRLQEKHHFYKSHENVSTFPIVK